MSETAHYSILAALHIFRVASTKAWDRIFMALGSFSPTIGRGARILSSHIIYNKGSWAAQKALLLWGPNMLIFTVHLTHTEFVKALHAESHVVSKPWIARPLYFTLNTILFLLMIFSVTMLVTTSDESKERQYTNLLKASLINTWLNFRLPHHVAIESIEGIPKWNQWNQRFGRVPSIIAIGHNVVWMQLLREADGFIARTEWTAYAFDIDQSTVVLLGWGIWYLPARCKAVVGKQKKGRDVIEGSDEIGYDHTGSQNINLEDTRYDP
ncbi:hypothetical protein BDV25DRAFT_127550 [Aspergillus avenaceus]|uniref:Uncharacterized protein n=1 Tax=Aspergillus avenaceus TaxID=36643 RepID=A0A5N6U2V7_ASPAV|nr:hypothetical protein BDV25DRAFT_127550 [Aspergillus avenaceus]